MKVNLFNSLEFTRFVSRFRGSLYTLLLIGFFGLSSLNSALNFAKSSPKIRDAAPLASNFATFETLSLTKNSVKIAKTNVSATPKLKTVASGSSFLIKNPTPTSDNSYISPYESGVKVYKDRFFFAHSTATFNWLKSAAEGNSFKVEQNGKTVSYKIAKKQVLKLNENYNGKAPVSAYYTSISERAQFLGKTYDIALMTCGDGSFGKDGNNSDFRTFIFAYAE